MSYVLNPFKFYISPMIALITGATAGFGEAIARKFAQNGWDLIITGRRQERLDSLKAELNQVKVLDLCFDVRDRSQVEEVLGSLPEEWQHIDLLVNNAGLASGFGPIQDGDPDDWDRMIDTNVKGLLYVSKAIMPGMKDRGRGHIINIGSTAGKKVYKNGNVYCASKHAVDALTKAMRIDLLPFGIKVMGICPGAAETEFALVRFHGDADKAKNVYNGYTPMNANDIAEVTWYAANTPPNLCLNDIVLTSLAQANSFYTEKIV